MVINHNTFIIVLPFLKKKQNNFRNKQLYSLYLHVSDFCFIQKNEFEKAFVQTHKLKKTDKMPRLYDWKHLQLLIKLLELRILCIHNRERWFSSWTYTFPVLIQGCCTMTLKARKLEFLLRNLTNQSSQKTTNYKQFLTNIHLKPNWSSKYFCIWPITSIISS